MEESVEKAEPFVIEEGGIIVEVDISDKGLTIKTNEATFGCPNCGSIIILNGKCKTCPDCGWSTCDI